jgi:hypothetical protein
MALRRRMRHNSKKLSEYPQFTLYRCTRFVTYTSSSVFAMGYAISDQSVLHLGSNLRFDPALETLDLYPKPKKRILEGNPQHGGKMITDLLTRLNPTARKIPARDK